MFLFKVGTSLKTRLYEEYSWDIKHNQKAIEFTTDKKKLIISRDVEVDESASWNLEKEKVVKSNNLVPMQQSKEETQEETEASTTLSPPPQQQQQLVDSSLESTLRRVRSLVDIYEA